MKIGTKVNIVLSIVFLASILISGVALANVLEQKAENEVAGQAEILMEMVNSIRNYTDSRVSPLLLSSVETQEKFIPEFVPTFATKEVFQTFSQQKKYANYVYKDATINPTSLEDKADPFETNIINLFRNDPNLKTKSEFRTISGQQLFYTARPFAITEQKCLLCHSTSTSAPKSLLATYGTEHGFGWKLNSIVATQIVYVPAEDVFANAHRQLILEMTVLISIFAALLLLMNILLRNLVIQRIKKIASVAEKVSTGDMNAEFGSKSKDEIGGLAVAFNRMKHSLEIALNMLNNPDS